jgi:hypothetical protein
MTKPQLTTGPAALQFDTDHWRSRWLVDRRWNALHRIASIELDEPDEMIVGEGVSICGRRRRFTMPGIFSRMGLKRCGECCRLLGIPSGDGAPFNVLEGERANA